MTARPLLLAAALTLAAALPAAAVEVTETMAVADLSPATVWAAHGDFCGIAAWHPTVALCMTEERDGKTVRLLGLVQGAGEIAEELAAWSPETHSYGYRIVDPGPLPVADYTATVTMVADGTGSLLTWTASFQAAGTTDDEARALVADILRAGLEGLVAAARGP